MFYKRSEDQLIQNYAAYKVTDLSIAFPFIFFASCMLEAGWSAVYRRQSTKLFATGKKIKIKKSVFRLSSRFGFYISVLSSVCIKETFSSHR